MDERVAQYVRETESFKKRLSGFAADLDAGQLQWTPPGIGNGIGWLVRHCADEFWFCYGQLSGARVPANLNQSGFPVPPEGFRPAAGRPYRWGYLTFDFDRAAPGPGPTGADHVPANCWTPPGIGNGIGWLVRHCADEFWFCYGQLSGARVPANLNQSGFPVPPEGFRPAAGRPYRWGYLTFDSTAPPRAPGRRARTTSPTSTGLGRRCGSTSSTTTPRGRQTDT